MTDSIVRQPVLRVNTPYKGAYRQELDEPESNETTATQDQPPEPQATPDPGPELSTEERTYKNRYDSLKAHYDKMINEARQREAELKGQLEKSGRRMELPSSPEEFKQWKETYPDLYRMLVTAIREEVKDTTNVLDERFEKVEQIARQARRDKAEAALLRLHPDFEELRADQSFHDWVKEQPAQIQAWLYDNEDDPLLAARAIDLYKADKGVKKQAKKVDVKEAAKAVTKTTPANEPELPQGKTWKVSDIKKLSPREFARVEEEIDKAAREGRIIIDM